MVMSSNASWGRLEDINEQTAGIGKQSSNEIVTDDFSGSGRQ